MSIDRQHLPSRHRPKDTYQSLVYCFGERESRMSAEIADSVCSYSSRSSPAERIILHVYDFKRVRFVSLELLHTASREHYYEKD